MKILVNTISAKSCAGGAFQISYNFLINTLLHNDIDWFYITSSDLDSVLHEKFDFIREKKYFVFPTQPDLKNSYWSIIKKVRALENEIKPDVVYSVTAPSYMFFRSKEVMRFTNPWVTHPNSYAWKKLTLVRKLKMFLYCFMQRCLMKRCSYFITQTETTKKGILRITNLPKANICVVSNVLPDVYNSLDCSSVANDDWIDIACIGNPVPHKNFDILPAVIRELKKRGLTNIRFHTTIPFNHPLLKRMNNVLTKDNNHKQFINHGRVTQYDLSKIYRCCRLCFFPSLLEVFSATIVEAMHFNLPIVAADFDFNRDVLSDACLYFEPMNASHAATLIMRLVEDDMLKTDILRNMRNRLDLFSDYNKHFEMTVNFLKLVANEKK